MRYSGEKKCYYDRINIILEKFMVQIYAKESRD